MAKAYFLLLALLLGLSDLAFSEQELASGHGPYPHNAPAPAPTKPPGHHHHHHNAPSHAPVHSPSHAPVHHHHHHHPHAPSHPPAVSPVHPPAVSPVHPPGHHHHPHVPSHAPAVSPVHPPSHGHHGPAVSPVHPPSHGHHGPAVPPVHPPSQPPSHNHHPRAPTPSPVHPPAKAPTKPGPVHPPAHPPNSRFPRSFVAVQGVVFCKSCKYAGVDTLTGATPLVGATVKLVCNNTKFRPIMAQAKTDKNGYFYVEAPKTITSYAAHTCKALLVSSPLASCSKPSLSGGASAGALRPEKHFFGYQKLPFVLYSVGPFAFEPTCKHA